MKKALLMIAALTFSAGSMANVNDIELKRGTMVCNDKDSIERFLDLKDHGVKREIKGCYKLRNVRKAEIDKRYPVKGYFKIKLNHDGKKVYINKDAAFRD